MESRDFLFELGMEEIPVGYINGAINTLRKIFVEELKKLKLSYTTIKIFSTPRRIAIKILGLQSKQNDEIINKVGPAKRVAYTEEGELSKAGLGFLRGAKASKENIYIKETPKGEYLAVQVEILGKSTEELLPQITINAIKKITFPKSMKWNSKTLTFARPIRWILALWGNKLLEFSYETIKSDLVTYGNRFVKIPYQVEINSIDKYEDSLKEAFVVADRNERKSEISRQLNTVLKGTDLHILEDSRLLDIVTDIVEFPTAVVAEYNEKYLDLPEKIIISTLTQNQMYFAVIDSKGKLQNKFVFISNGNPEYKNIIKLGNEKVVKARLEDAEFYYKEDTKHSLESFIPKLSEVTFQAKLGSLLEKTERIIKITKKISFLLKIDDSIKNRAIRAAELCKADLVSLMLGEKEFTKLQGYIGMNYALKSGEPTQVATAIYEHYMPRGQNDSLPESMEGAIVAFADKLDTVCGIIGAGLIPTGSNDPFALRRAANGVVQIIDKFVFEIDIFTLISFSFDLLEIKLGNRKNEQIAIDFFKQRVNWLLQQKNIDYDIIESVTYIMYSSLPDLLKRAQDLREFKSQESFVKLVLGFKRVSNIISKEKNILPFEKSLLKENAEIELYEEYEKLSIILKTSLAEKDYVTVMNSLVSYSAFIDKFFDDVLVNVEEKNIRANRYALLNNIRKLFLKVADLAKIVVEGDNQKK